MGTQEGKEEVPVQLPQAPRWDLRAEKPPQLFPAGTWGAAYRGLITFVINSLNGNTAAHHFNVETFISLHP